MSIKTDIAATAPVVLPTSGDALRGIRLFAWVCGQDGYANTLVWASQIPDSKDKGKTVWVPALDRKGRQLEMEVWIQ